MVFDKLHFFDRQRFAKQFQTEHTTFLNAIQDVSSSAAPLINREQFASSMLHRLMLLYFIQKKGWLNGNLNYLSDKLHMLQEDGEQNRFFPFYRHLLTRLFQPGTTADEPATEAIPLLNTHLFTPDELAHDHAQFIVPDAAFRRIFRFFDTYQWQLDERLARHATAITPDLMSYTFEKYLDQKQMGAYYTAEDITNYIGANTIIARIFQRTQQHYTAAFQDDGTIWSLLRMQPDRYLPDTLRCESYLPDESTREYQLRRTRYHSLAARLRAGEITTIQDLITEHLNIQQFAEDSIQNCQDSTLLHTFYESISQITILDPTCGSGAFLCAALNILIPLYTACFATMQRFLAEQSSMPYIGFFSTILQQMMDYPDLDYFIMRNIITHNLYGIDIMREAVEICKIRLFLKLAAHVQNPITTTLDLDFHILTGNTLIGVISQIDQHKQVADASRAELDLHLARAYGINDADHSQLIQWHRSHQPFHWCLEFPTIIEQGGFEVIIGNPPYVEYSKARQAYKVPGYEMVSCGNLYAAVIERSLALCRPEQTYLGLIVPLSICSGERFEQLRRTIRQHTADLWLANFEIFPCRLFAGAFQRVSILLARHSTIQQHLTHVTRIQRWYAKERPHLIEQITYTTIQRIVGHQIVPKLASTLQETILQKVLQRSAGIRIAQTLQPHKTEHFVYYQEATNYWTKASCRIPFYKKDGTITVPTHGRLLYFACAQDAKATMALLNSSLFYVWFATFSDGFHLSHTLVKEFPTGQHLYTLEPLQQIATLLEKHIQAHTSLSTRHTRVKARQTQIEHQIELEEYHMSSCKPLLDQIDCILAEHYGLTSEELDFIINYDIKYRMGRDNHTI